jgi:hypothetical protein
MTDWTLYMVVAAFTVACAVALVWYHVKVWYPLVQKACQDPNRKKGWKDKNALIPGNQIISKKVSLPASELERMSHEDAPLTLSMVSGAIAKFLSRSASEIKDRLSQLSRTISEQQEILPTHTKEIIDVTLPQSALWYHYVRDAFREKAAIADYVSRNFLKSELRSFVQASTTAIHLGRYFGTNHSLSTLFYTNSIVFPCTVLQENAFHQVYTFCGPIYDQLCGGWLFPLDDSRTAGELRKLFTRQEDPLTTAFLMPTAMKVDSGAFYMRAEAAAMARILIAEAKHIIIMAPGPRLYGPGDDLPPDQSWNCAWGPDWKGLQKNVSLIISGIPNRGNLHEILRLFEEHGLEIHWQDVSGGWSVGTDRLTLDTSAALSLARK